MTHHPQRPGCRNSRILLPQRTRCGVARVGERGLTRVAECGVQRFEPLDRKVDLASNLKKVVRLGKASGLTPASLSAFLGK